MPFWCVASVARRVTQAHHDAADAADAAASAVHRQVRCVCPCAERWCCVLRAALAAAAAAAALTVVFCRVFAVACSKSPAVPDMVAGEGSPSAPPPSAAPSHTKRKAASTEKERPTKATKFQSPAVPDMVAAEGSPSAACKARVAAPSSLVPPPPSAAPSHTKRKAAFTKEERPTKVTKFQSPRFLKKVAAASKKIQGRRITREVCDATPMRDNTKEDTPLIEVRGSTEAILNGDAMVTELKEPSDDGTPRYIVYVLIGPRTHGIKGAGAKAVGAAAAAGLSANQQYEFEPGFNFVGARPVDPATWYSCSSNMVTRRNHADLVDDAVRHADDLHAGSDSSTPEGAMELARDVHGRLGALIEFTDNNLREDPHAGKHIVVRDDLMGCRKATKAWQRGDPTVAAQNLGFSTDIQITRGAPKSAGVLAFYAEGTRDGRCIAQKKPGVLLHLDWTLNSTYFATATSGGIFDPRHAHDAFVAETGLGGEGFHDELIAVEGTVGGEGWFTALAQLRADERHKKRLSALRSADKFGSTTLRIAMGFPPPPKGADVRLEEWIAVACVFGEDVAAALSACTGGLSVLTTIVACFAERHPRTAAGPVDLIERLEAFALSVYNKRNHAKSWFLSLTEAVHEVFPDPDSDAHHAWEKFASEAGHDILSVGDFAVRTAMSPVAHVALLRKAESEAAKSVAAAAEAVESIERQGPCANKPFDSSPATLAADDDFGMGPGGLGSAVVDATKEKVDTLMAAAAEDPLPPAARLAQANLLEERFTGAGRRAFMMNIVRAVLAKATPAQKQALAEVDDDFCERRAGELGDEAVAIRAELAEFKAKDGLPRNCVRSDMSREAREHVETGDIPSLVVNVAGPHLASALLAGAAAARLLQKSSAADVLKLKQAKAAEKARERRKWTSQVPVVRTRAAAAPRSSSRKCAAPSR